MTDQYYYDRGNGYVDPAPSSSGSKEKSEPASIVPAYESSTMIQGGAANTVVYGGGSHWLMNATGTGRTQTVKNVGTTTAYVYPQQNEMIDGAISPIPIPPNTSFGFLDYSLYQWATVATTSEPTFYHRVVVDEDYTISGPASQSVGYPTLTSNRAVTLPSANIGGQTIVIRDESGSASWSTKISIVADGSDTIHASATSLSIWVAYGSITLQSNGLGKWFITARSPRIWYTRWTANTTFVVEPDVSWLEFRAQGGGGGGGAAGTAAGPSYRGGGGGGAGAYSFWEGQQSAGASLSVTVGSGGVYRTSGSDSQGGSGGSSSVGSLVTANGGTGGDRGSNFGGGGAGGARQSMASINVIGHPLHSVSSATWAIHVSVISSGGSGGSSGGSGSDGSTVPSSPVWFSGGTGGTTVGGGAGGGGGAASLFGAGGNGGYNNSGTLVNGVSATGYGSGGGGAVQSTLDGSTSDSGSGAPGFVDAWVTF